MPRMYPLAILAILIAALVILPVGSLLMQIFRPDEHGVWQHLVDTVLADYVINSFWLAIGTGVGAALLGTGSAWLISMYRFPGRGILEWALLLPLAMPTYVIAYVYTDVLQYSGPVQSWLRSTFNWERGDYWFFEISSLAGAIVVFSLVFYPYVYVLARATFIRRAWQLEDVARSLGMSRIRAFFHVLLPSARPAIVAGMALVMMEALAEFGAVSYFGVSTFTTGIYRAWYAFSDPIAASQLAVSLLGLVVLALALEKFSRGQARYYDIGGRASDAPTLRGIRMIAVWVACLIPLAGGFLVPVALLLGLMWQGSDPQFGFKYLTLVGNSLALALTACLLTLVVALLLGYAGRLNPGTLMNSVKRLASLGYAVPGTVIAVGVLLPLTVIDHAVIDWMHDYLGVTVGLLLTGSVFALVFAYLTRFLAIALHTVEASMIRIRPNLDDAACGLGLSRWQVLLRVHLPLLRGGMLSALLLVFVEVMKELPATIVLRPFNFDTLATQVFILAADERLAEAATPSLMIVVVGLIPVVLLSRAMRGAYPQ